MFPVKRAKLIQNKPNFLASLNFLLHTYFIYYHPFRPNSQMCHYSLALRPFSANASQRVPCGTHCSSRHHRQVTQPRVRIRSREVCEPGGCIIYSELLKHYRATYLCTSVSNAVTSTCVRSIWSVKAIAATDDAINCAHFFLVPCRMSLFVRAELKWRVCHLASGRCKHVGFVYADAFLS